MSTYSLDNTILTVKYNDQRIYIDAVYGADIFRAYIEGQSRQSYDIVCELFDAKNISISVYPNIMLMKIPYMENQIAMKRIR
jgi:hypothetical protein